MNIDIKKTIIIAFVGLMILSTPSAIYDTWEALKGNAKKISRYYSELHLYYHMRNESSVQCSPYLGSYGEKKYEECITNYTYVYVAWKGYEKPAIKNLVLQQPEREMKLNNWFNRLSNKFFITILPWVDISYDGEGKSKAIKKFSSKRHEYYIEDNPL